MEYAGVSAGILESKYRDLESKFKIADMHVSSDFFQREAIQGTIYPAWLREMVR